MAEQQQTPTTPRALTASGWQPPASALAARSLAAVDRIADPVRRRAAFARHLDEFPPTVLARRA